MKKALSIWGLLSALGLLTLASIPIADTEGEPLKWERIPQEIIDTIDLPTQADELVLHYEPIEPMYETRDFTYDEAQMLMRIAQAEAGNQGIEGMMLVMTVVLNRVQDEAFPNSIEGVIFQKHQFQPVDDGRYYSVEISTDAHRALANIEKGIPLDETIVAFEITANNKSLERYFTFAYTKGQHDFYVTKGE